MSIDTLQRHFADCDLPIKLIATDPRPIHWWMKPRSFQHEDDFFFLDVVTQRKRVQHFRLFVHDTASVHVMDKNPKTRHLLLQTRCLPVNAEKELVSHVLLGHDERQLFIVRSGRVSTVRDALARLKPWDVRRAEHRGWKVIRQGDWFFVPLHRTVNITSEMILHWNEPIGGPNAGRWGMRTAHPHIAEEQALVFAQQPIPSGIRTETVLAAIFVRGKIRHEEHATIELRTWHRAVQNTAVAQPSFIYYYD